MSVGLTELQLEMSNSKSVFFSFPKHMFLKLTGALWRSRSQTRRGVHQFDMFA